MLQLDAAAPAKHNNRKKKKKENLLCSYGGTFRVFAMSNASPPPSFKMNLNEYMVTLEKPLGIRFALSVHGKVFVHALKKGSNAEKSRIIMVGDTLKKAGDSSGGRLIEIKDFTDTRKMLKELSGPFSLVLERPFSPFPIHQLHLMGDLDVLFNRGRVSVASWNKSILASNFQTSSESTGNSGFAMFSSKFLTSQGCFDIYYNYGSFFLGFLLQGRRLFDMRKKLPFCVGLLLRCLKKDHRVFVTCTTGFDRSPACVIAYLHWMTDTSLHAAYNFVTGLHICRPDRFLTDPPLFWIDSMVEKGEHDGPGTHAVTFIWNGQEGEDVNLVGDFTGNWKEPIKAIHKGGSRYEVEITEQIYVGSCIQTEAEVETLSNVAGVTAVLNFQSRVEAENWGINSNSINESCQRSNILMINYPIREGDSFDMRKKLPFCVGLLLRLLKKNHRVFVTCTTGFDRSPACVIAYLHWMTDTSLHAAYNFVTGLHICRPDRPAIAWATWDLIAMVEKGEHDGPGTHAVTFIWNGQEGEDVNLVGDFTGNWKEPIKAIHKGGSRYEVEVRLSQGK
ncbi:phosphoglucan phosphatase LSF1, chloroplastic-like [Quercus suber]|uniref:phosphoglucan phosphatase LSF1, chloroplastic-like n=1 Tax=Quercus suber TaxID=58331 RepID=UPI0032DF6EE6